MNTKTGRFFVNRHEIDGLQRMALIRVFVLVRVGFSFIRSNSHYDRSSFENWDIALAVWNGIRRDLESLNRSQRRENRLDPMFLSNQPDSRFRILSRAFRGLLYRQCVDR